MPIRMFALMDDLTFGPNGLAASPVNRGDRYTSAFLLQLPKNNVPQEVNLKVIRLSGPFTRQRFDRNAVFAVGAGHSRQRFGPMSTSGLPLRLNSWILLSSSTPEPFADFYRVVGITESQVSVSPPIRTHGTSTYAPNGAILDNVVEVFDRGTITPSKWQPRDL